MDKINLELLFDLNEKLCFHRVICKHTCMAACEIVVGGQAFVKQL